MCGNELPDVLAYLNALIQAASELADEVLTALFEACPEPVATDSEGRFTACGVPLASVDQLREQAEQLVEEAVELLLSLNPCPPEEQTDAAEVEDPVICGFTVPVGEILSQVDDLLQQAGALADAAIAAITALCAQPNDTDDQGRIVICGIPTVNPDQFIEDTLALAFQLVDVGVGTVEAVVAMILAANPCDDLQEEQTAEGDPVLCGIPVPVTTVTGLVNSVAHAAEECLRLEIPNSDYDQGDQEGTPAALQVSCDALWDQHEFTVPWACGVEDKDSDGVPVVLACSATLVLDLDSDQRWTLEGSDEREIGDPDDGDAENPIFVPEFEVHSEIEPECGGHYKLGISFSQSHAELYLPDGGPTVVEGDVPCPLPYTTPAYPIGAVLGDDQDNDGLPATLNLHWQSSTVEDDGTLTSTSTGTSTITIDEDDRDSWVPGNVSRPHRPTEYDWQGFADYWEQQINETVDAAVDLDQDGLNNIDEFRWDLIPVCIPYPDNPSWTGPKIQNCRDHESNSTTGADGDAWYDGPEVEWWNDESNDVVNASAPMVSLQDTDRLHDTDQDGLRDLDDRDSDNDGVLDGLERGQATYPELADSDCSREATECTKASDVTNRFEARQGQPGSGDNLPDGLERLAWDALASASWDSDSDGDGIWNLLDPDSDTDGLFDGDEFTLGQGQVRPDLTDTDNDAWIDGNETLWYFDSDGDSWLNAADPDSDNDGMPDGWEVAYQFNPLQADGTLDFDQDGLMNVLEYRYRLPGGWDVRQHGVWWGGTNPVDPDTDDDELLDGIEVLTEGTDPFQWDTDGDALPDAWEVRYKRMGASVSTNPVNYDPDADVDADSANVPWCDGDEGSQFDNLAEYQFGMPVGWSSQPPSSGGLGVYWDGTFPNDPDTDDDGIEDGYEACTDRIDPRTADVLTGGDLDQDGLDNEREYREFLSNLFDPDSDLDSLCDGGNALNCSVSSFIGEVFGWTTAQGRSYTSDPVQADTDGEGLPDNGERALSTNPRVGDTDADSLSDANEDTDGDWVIDEWDTDPLRPDTDFDGVSDGDEDIHGIDGTVSDTDEDGLSDGQELALGTDAANADTDADYIPDAVEAGYPSRDPASQYSTSVLDPDSDNDGLLDGEEVYFFGLNPNYADSDCDRINDGLDANPYDNNLPPGTTLSSSERWTCAPGSVRYAPYPMPGTPSNVIGVVVFEQKGWATVFARPPASENRVEVMEGMVQFEGWIRTSASGAQTWSTSTVRAELRLLDEPVQDPQSGAQFTHGIRIGLPEGMVEATAAKVAVSMMDSNLNAVTYTGEAGSILVQELTYEETPTQSQVQDCNTGPTQGSSWDYMHQGVTGGGTGGGGQANPGSSASAGLPITGLPAMPRTIGEASVFHIIQPATPSLVGSLVDDVLVMTAPGATSVYEFAVYNQSLVRLPESQLPMYTASASFWDQAVQVHKVVAQASTRAMATFTSVTTDVANAVGKAGRHAKQFTVELYDFVANPACPAAMAARVGLDIAGVGDLIDIWEGIEDGDWVLLGLGVAGLATTVATIATAGAAAPLEGAVTGIKVAHRTANYAADVVDIAAKVTTKAALDGSSSLAIAAKRYSTLGKLAAEDSATAGDGLRAFARAEEASATGGRQLVDTRLETRFLANQAPGRSPAELATWATAFHDSPISLGKAAKFSAKLERMSPGDAGSAMTALKRLAESGVSGADGVVNSALKMNANQAKGHAYTLQKAAAKLDELGPGSINLGASVPTSRGLLRPDAVYATPAGQVFTEYKNYDGVFSASKFNAEQMRKYAEAADDAGGKAQYIVKNGQVSKGVRDLITDLNAGLNAKYGTTGQVWIEILDDVGRKVA